MRRRISHALTSALADEGVYPRIDGGRQLLGGVVLTDQEIVFSKGIRRVFMPYAEIVWAFRRVEESHVTLGCCGGVLQEFHLVLRNASGREVLVTFDRENLAVAALDHIAAHSQAAIGYTAEHKARFNEDVE